VNGFIASPSRDYCGKGLLDGSPLFQSQTKPPDLVGSARNNQFRAAEHKPNHIIAVISVFMQTDRIRHDTRLGRQGVSTDLCVSAFQQKALYRNDLKQV
jgi:hypothetical protein